MCMCVYEVIHYIWWRVNCMCYVTVTAVFFFVWLNLVCIRSSKNLVIFISLGCRDDYHNYDLVIFTGRFLHLLTSPWLCAAWWLVHHWLQGTYEFGDESVCLTANNIWNYGRSLTMWATWQYFVSWWAVCVIHGNLFMICQQWAAIISSISCLFSVIISEQFCHGAVYFRPTCISVWHMWNTALLESVRENFMMKEFPADK
jgi:hypothetical protein